MVDPIAAERGHLVRGPEGEEVREEPALGLGDQDEGARRRQVEPRALRAEGAVGELNRADVSVAEQRAQVDVRGPVGDGVPEPRAAEERLDGEDVRVPDLGGGREVRGEHAGHRVREVQSEQGDGEAAVPAAPPADMVDQHERSQERGQHGAVREQVPVLGGGPERVHDEGVDERRQERDEEEGRRRLAGAAEPLGQAPGDQGESDGVHQEPLVQHVEEVLRRDEPPRRDEDEPAVGPVEVEGVDQRRHEPGRPAAHVAQPEPAVHEGRGQRGRERRDGAGPDGQRTRAQAPGAEGQHGGAHGEDEGNVGHDGDPAGQPGLPEGPALERADRRPQEHQQREEGERIDLDVAEERPRDAVGGEEEGRREPPSAGRMHASQERQPDHRCQAARETARQRDRVTRRQQWMEQPVGRSERGAGEGPPREQHEALAPVGGDLEHVPAVPQVDVRPERPREPDGQRADRRREGHARRGAAPGGRVRKGTARASRQDGVPSSGEEDQRAQRRQDDELPTPRERGPRVDSPVDREDRRAQVKGDQGGDQSAPDRAGAEWRGSVARRFEERDPEADGHQERPPRERARLAEPPAGIERRERQPGARGQRREQTATVRAGASSIALHCPAIMAHPGAPTIGCTVGSD